MKKFILKHGFIKKIKKFKKNFFLIVNCNNLNINLFIKKNNFIIKKTIICFYGFYFKNFFIIYEFSIYNKKINKLKYNYINFKSKFYFFIRNFFYKLNYMEIETIIIDKFSNSGSKQFLLIDKNKKKNFYSLSQSPQKNKQFYIFNNIKKYFQIVKCFRNEDNRSSRLNEFYQLDIENSFTYFKKLKKIINIFLNSLFYYYIKKKIFVLIIKYKYIKKFFYENKNFNFPYIIKKVKIKKFFLYIIKFFKKKITFFYKKILFINYNKYLFIIVKKKIDYNIFYFLELNNKKNNFINNKIIIIWIINFYYFNKNKINHHHFSSFKNNISNFYKSKSLSYDIIINGLEIGGGSIRNINFKLQKKNYYFIKNKKSFFLNYYKTAIPQHCGIAIGIERILKILCLINLKLTNSYFKYKKNIISLKINE